MRTLSPDTSPQAERVMFELLRDVPPERKLRMVASMNATVRHLAVMGLKQRHPAADDEEIRRRLADILLGPERAALVYGPPSY